MVQIEWTDGMSVGVEMLDQDHQRLIALLNQLDEVAQGGEDPPSIMTIIRDLVRYTEYHFESEERLMRLSRYPDTDAHVRIHRDIRRRMVSFEQKFQEDPIQSNLEPLRSFLSNWLTTHILGEDMKYRPYMTRDTTQAPTGAA